VPYMRGECNDPQGRLRLLHCMRRSWGVWLKHERLIISPAISRANSISF